MKLLESWLYYSDEEHSSKMFEPQLKSQSGKYLFLSRLYIFGVVEERVEVGGAHTENSTEISVRLIMMPTYFLVHWVNFAPFSAMTMRKTSADKLHFEQFSTFMNNGTDSRAIVRRKWRVHSSQPYAKRIVPMLTGKHRKDVLPRLAWHPSRWSCWRRSGKNPERFRPTS